MPSGWSKKLETRLSALADGASKESLQTLANWMAFNRKHAAALASTIANAIEQAGPTRQWLYLQLVHEVLLLDIDTPEKWDRLADLRTAVGETALVPAIGSVAEDERVAKLMDQWEERNVFGSPTLMGQIRRSRMQAVNATKTNTQSTSPPATQSEETSEAVKTSSVNAKENVKEEQLPPEEVKDADQISEKRQETEQKENKQHELDIESATVSKPELSENPSTTSAVPVKSQPISFDFEKEGIPEAKVEAKEFLEPCRAIATFQIARELRNDSALQLSSILSTIPEEVENFCQKVKDDQEVWGNASKLSEEEIDGISMKLNEEVLDMDLDEMQQNIKTFREIIQKQRAARERLVYLLIQSRCQFGSREAAETFYGLDDISTSLQKRKAILLDAMELEGLDFEEQKDNKSDQVGKGDKELEPLTWYDSSKPNATKTRNH